MDEEKPKKKKHNKGRNLLIDLATFLVVAVIAVLAIILLGQADGTVTSEGNTVEISGLQCEKSGTDNPFLRPGFVPSSGLHKINANFKNDKLTDAMYSYTATYGSNVDLSAAKTNIHADFDLAYGNALVHRDGVWSESFSVSESSRELRMSVYSEAGNLKASNAEVFMLDNGVAFPKTLTELKEAYEAKGFSCQVSE